MDREKRNHLIRLFVAIAAVYGLVLVLELTMRPTHMLFTVLKKRGIEEKAGEHAIQQMIARSIGTCMRICHSSRSYDNVPCPYFCLFCLYCKAVFSLLYRYSFPL